MGKIRVDVKSDKSPGRIRLFMNLEIGVDIDYGVFYRYLEEHKSAYPFAARQVKRILMQKLAYEPLYSMMKKNGNLSEQEFSECLNQIDLLMESLNFEFVAPPHDNIRLRRPVRPSVCPSDIPPSLVAIEDVFLQDLLNQ